MAITLIGTKRDGVVTWKGDRWWAEGGLVHCEDKTGHFTTIPVRDVLQRLKALNDMIGTSRAHPDGIAGHHDAMVDHLGYIEQMIGLCQRAQSQGRPDDPKAVAQMRRDNEGHTRLHVMPGLNARF